MRRLEHSNKPIIEKFDNVKRLMVLEKSKIEDQAYEKAKKANILFSTEYKYFFSLDLLHYFLELK